MTLLYMADAARRSPKLRPRHFLNMIDWFLPPNAVQWASDLQGAPSGCTLVIRAPDSYSLSQLGKKKGKLCVFDYISLDEYRYLTDRNGKLLLDMGWEVLFPREELVRGLHDELVTRGVDPASVLILNSNMAAQESFQKRWPAETQLPPCVVLSFPTSFALLIGYQNSVADMSQISSRLKIIRESLHSSRNKKFNLFGGRARPYRLYSLAFLHKYCLDEYGYISMLGYDILSNLDVSDDQSVKEAVSDLKKRTYKYPNFDTISSSYEAIMSQLPMVLDTGKRHFPDVATMESLAWQSQDMFYYDQSYFSFVLDTLLFDPDMLFVTEKPGKAMMNGSPFIYLGNPGALAELRSLGFETFAPELNEAYDAARDPFERLRLWLAEAGRLAGLTDSELIAIRYSLWPRIEHNYRHFWDRLHRILRERFETEVMARIAARG